MVCVYFFQRVQGHMCSMGLSQQVWGVGMAGGMETE